MCNMNIMGSMNVGWGVCGFTSSFYAMYAQNPTRRTQQGAAGAAHRVLAEIKSYLMLLKAENNNLLRGIENFTRSFGIVDGTDFSTFTIDSYIVRINQ